MVLSQPNQNKFIGVLGQEKNSHQDDKYSLSFLFVIPPEQNSAPIHVYT